MLDFRCPMCDATDESDEALSGQTVRCRQRCELVRVLPPEAATKEPQAKAKAPQAPPPPPPAPARPEPRRPPAEEPWYYQALDLAGHLAVGLAVMAALAALID